MKKTVEHFYWVSQGNGLPQGTPAYHVQVIETAETMAEVRELGGATRTLVLNVTQAEAAGFDLAAIRELVNADLAKLLDEARADLAIALAANESLSLAIGELSNRQAVKEGAESPAA